MDVKVKERGVKEDMPNGQIDGSTGTTAKDLTSGVKNQRSVFRHVEFAVLLRMYVELSKISLYILYILYI